MELNSGQRLGWKDPFCLVKESGNQFKLDVQCLGPSPETFPSMFGEEIPPLGRTLAGGVPLRRKNPPLLKGLQVPIQASDVQGEPQVIHVSFEELLDLIPMGPLMIMDSQKYPWGSKIAHLLTGTRAVFEIQVYSQLAYLLSYYTLYSIAPHGETSIVRKTISERSWDDFSVLFRSAVLYL
jgi:hypothetical protein